jgi:5'-methylthioadenosine phosphorylase
MRETKIGLIGGSGLGAALSAQTEGQHHDIQTPFGPPSGPILETRWNDVPVFVLGRHGVGHRFNPSQVPYRANIFALKQLGVTHILASGAVGSLRDGFEPRELVIPDQIIDKTHKRANTFFDAAAVHVEFAEPFCPVLRRILIEVSQEPPAEQADVPAPATVPTVHPRGCYVAMEGPAFSTRAESLMHRLWGGDLIGMTCMPEAKLAREAEIAYALIALVTDYDCWKTAAHSEGQEKPDPFVLLKEIIGNLETATANAMALMKRAVVKIAGMTPEALESPAHHALRLGIWSDKAKLPAEEVQRLAPLWGAYFQ